jgi:hypothetical protein
VLEIIVLSRQNIIGRSETIAGERADFVLDDLEAGFDRTNHQFIR